MDKAHPYDPSTAAANAIPNRHEIEHWLGRQDSQSMRRHIEDAPVEARDLARVALQKAAQTAVVDPNEEEDMALLVGLPVVLGFRGKSEAVPLPELVKHSERQLQHRLQGMWNALLPGHTVAAMPVAVRLDLALAAEPSDVRDCAEQAAALLACDGTGQYFFGGPDSHKVEWAVPPVPAVYLALAAVRYRSGDGEPDLTKVQAMGLRAAAGLMRGLFATRVETPRIAVTMPQPFFRAAECALSGQLKFMTDPTVNGAPKLGKLLLNLTHSAASNEVRVRLSAPDADLDVHGDQLMSWRINWEWRTKAALSSVIEEVRFDDGDGPRWVEFDGDATGGITH